MWPVLTPKGNLNNYSTTESRSLWNTDNVWEQAFQYLEVKDRGKQPQDVPSDKHCKSQYATSQAAELLGQDKGAIDGVTEEGSKKHYLCHASSRNRMCLLSL